MSPFEQDFKSSSRKLILATWALIFVLAIGLMWYAVDSGTPMRFYDERSYFEIAQSLAAGQGFEVNGVPTATRPPVWPLVLSVFLRCGVPAHALAIAPAIAIVAAALVASAIGRHIAGHAYGRVAGVIILVYPLNIYTGITLYPQAFATFLILLQWLVWIRLRCPQRSSRRLWRYASLGLVGALVGLSAPVLAFTGFIVVVAAIVNEKDGRHLGHVTASTLGFAVPIIAWSIRNFRELGGVVFLSTSDGLNLLIGNNPSATASSGVAVDISDQIRAASSMSEIESSRYFRHVALQWITSNPWDALVLYLEKTIHYFSAFDQPATPIGSTALMSFVAYSSAACVVILLALRFAFRRRLSFDRTERMYLLIYMINALVMAVFFTRLRFRQPLDNILLIEASIAVVGILLAIGGSSRRLGTAV